MKRDRTTLFFEDDFHFKLILHERDFVPGVTIHANIVDAIKHSRRMIMILSRLISKIFFLFTLNLLLANSIPTALPYTFFVA